LLALLLGVPALAAAQQGGPDLRIGAGMVLDFAGGVDINNGAPGGDRTLDLRVTPGLRAHLDYDVHKYISIGGFTRFSWWRAHGNDYLNDDRRNFMWDLGARVQRHYDWRDFRFYLAIMPGLTLDKLKHGQNYGLDNPGVGWAVAVAPGFEWWFSNRAALFLEMFGWSGHGFHHDYSNVNGSLDFRLNQVLWQFGVVFAP
jgi:hypothetical protein